MVRQTLSQSGEEWDRKIREDIGQCSHFVVLLTENALAKGSYVRKEMATAVAVQKGLPRGYSFIFPVILSEDDLSAIRSDSTVKEVRKHMWTDLSSDWSGGIDRLANELGKRPGPASKKTFFPYYLLGSASLIFTFVTAFFVRHFGIASLRGDSYSGIALLVKMELTALLFTLLAVLFGMGLVRTRTKLGALAVGLGFGILGVLGFLSLMHK